MKSIKIAMAAFVVTAGLVASFAFTSKPFSIVDYLYTPSSTQKVIDPTDDNAIIASELNTSVSTNWTSGSIGSHSNATKLKGIEFDMAQLLSLQNAADGVNAYYTATGTQGTLPADGGTLPKVVNGTSYNVTVFRF